jgi:hypothetical protein
MVIVDGDNCIDPRFLTQQFELTPDLWDNTVLSFSSRNSINGLIYGNGGIKCWPRHVALEMQTHESAADPSGLAGVDFCWALDYVLMPGVSSQARINATAHQAWRAGFREGVKFTLVDGQPATDPAQWLSQCARVNLDRLIIWAQVGADVAHGLWAILGARQGVYYSLFTDWDTTRVQDFDQLDSLWEDRIQHMNPWDESQVMGNAILSQLALDITEKPLISEHSRWFKQIHAHAPRTQAKRMKN